MSRNRRSSYRRASAAAWQIRLLPSLAALFIGIALAGLSGGFAYFLPAHHHRGPGHRPVGGGSQPLASPPSVASPRRRSQGAFTVLLLGSDDDAKFDPEARPHPVDDPGPGRPGRQAGDDALDPARPLGAALRPAGRPRSTAPTPTAGAAAAIATVQQQLQGPDRRLRLDRAEGPGQADRRARRGRRRHQQPGPRRLLPRRHRRRQPVRLPAGRRAARPAAPRRDRTPWSTSARGTATCEGDFGRSAAAAAGAARDPGQGQAARTLPTSPTSPPPSRASSRRAWASTGSASCCPWPARSTTPRRSTRSSSSRPTPRSRTIDSQSVVLPHWDLILPLVHQYFP